MVALIALLLPVVAAEVHHIKSDNYIGCIEKDEYSRLVKLAASGDTEAFGKAVAQDVMLGTAIIFQKGQSVYLEDTAMWEGMIKVRLQGEATGYWTAMEAID